MAQLGDAAKTETKDKIRKFVINNFLLGDDNQILNDNASFLEQGIIDSTGILELVSFVQETFDIRIEDMELMPDNLDSLNKLEAFIAKKSRDTPMRLYDFVRNSAKNHPDKIAVVHHKERLTYCRLDRESNLLAEELVVKGVKKGDRVGLFLDNGCEYLTAYFGILKTGAVVVGLNSQYVARELVLPLNDCAPKIIITDLKHSHTVNEALKNCCHSVGLWVMDKAFTRENTISQKQRYWILTLALMMIWR